MADLLLPNGTKLPLRGPLTIGSAGDADLKLELPGVDSYHCAIRPLKGGGFGIKDLGSEGGTFVDGRRIQALRLRPGASIQIGGAELVFQDGSEEERPSQASAASSASSTGSSSGASSKANQEQTSKPKSRAKRDRAKRDKADLPPGTELAGYRILAVCGHGGMGTVYRALQVSLGREVALKVLRRDLCEDPDFVDRFLSEARAAARFNHPNVVSVFDVGIDKGRPFYSMELLDHGSLEDVLKQKGKLEVDEAIRAIRDATRGLVYAEQLGLVHRDLKPENLMRTQDGRSKICDLGLAGNPEDVLAGKVAGTPHFMSPEQIRREPLDHRSDLYSLGVTFYRLLTGKTPFSGKTVKEILKAHLEASPPSVRALCPEAPEELDEVLRKLLAKKPEERFQSASELLETLDQFSKDKTRSKGLLILMGILVLGLVGGIAYLLTREPEVRIKTIQKKDPKAAALEKKNFELEALNAWHQIPKDLSEEQRIQKLKALIHTYKGTPTARRAEQEIPKLQQRILEKQRRLQEEKQKQARLLEGFQTEPQKLLTQGSYRKAMERALLLSQQIKNASKTSAALEQLRSKVRAAWKADIDKTLMGLQEEAKKANLLQLKALSDKARALQQELLRPIPGIQGGADLGQGFAAFRKFLRERSKKQAALHLLELRKQRDRLLFGEGGVLQALKEGKLPQAEALLSAPEQKELAPLLAPVTPLLGLAQKGQIDYVRKATSLLLETRSWLQKRKAGDLKPPFTISLLPLLPPKIREVPEYRNLELGMERLRTMLYAMQQGGETIAAKVAKEIAKYDHKDILGLALGLQ